MIHESRWEEVLNKIAVLILAVCFSRRLSGASFCFFTVGTKSNHVLGVYRVAFYAIVQENGMVPGAFSKLYTDTHV